MFYNDTMKRYELSRTKDWHRWFAWKPTTIGDKTVWLRFVYRRGYRYDLRAHLINRGPAFSGWQWEYANDLLEVLAKADDPFPPMGLEEKLTTPPPPPPPRILNY